MKIPFLVGWTSILSQLFWCELQGFNWFCYPHCQCLKQLDSPPLAPQSPASPRPGELTVTVRPWVKRWPKKNRNLDGLWAIKTYETFKGGHKNLWKKNKGSNSRWFMVIKTYEKKLRGTTRHRGMPTRKWRRLLARKIAWVIDVLLGDKRGSRTNLNYYGLW